MKHLISLSILGISLATSAVVIAQNSRPRVIKVPDRKKVPHVTPTPLQGKTPKVTPTPSKIIHGQRIGERFRLKVWAVVLSGMPTRDWCGTLKINDQLRWNIPQEESASHRLGSGALLEISEDTAHRQGGQLNFSALYGNPRKVKLWFDFFSVDSGRTTLRAAYRDQLDLLRESGKIYKCTMGKGEVALYVQVEHTGYLYAPLIQRPLPTPTSRFHPPPHIP